MYELRSTTRNKNHQESSFVENVCESEDSLTITPATQYDVSSDSSSFDDSSDSSSSSSDDSDDSDEYIPEPKRPRRLAVPIKRKRETPLKKLVERQKFSFGSSSQQVEPINVQRNYFRYVPPVPPSRTNYNRSAAEVSIQQSSFYSQQRTSSNTSTIPSTSEKVPQQGPPGLQRSFAPQQKSLSTFVSIPNSNINPSQQGPSIQSQPTRIYFQRGKDIHEQVQYPRPVPAISHSTIISRPIKSIIAHLPPVPESEISCYVSNRNGSNYACPTVIRTGELRYVETAFDNSQLALLEEVFQSMETLSRQKVIELAIQLKKSHEQIKKWFFDRRKKMKEENREESGDVLCSPEDVHQEASAPEAHDLFEPVFQRYPLYHYVFCDANYNFLVQELEKNPLPKRAKREEWALKMGVKEYQVDQWFSERRAEQRNERREINEEQV